MQNHHWLMIAIVAVVFYVLGNWMILGNWGAKIPGYGG